MNAHKEKQMKNEIMFRNGDSFENDYPNRRQSTEIEQHTHEVNRIASWATQLEEFDIIFLAITDLCGSLSLAPAPRNPTDRKRRP